MTAVVYDIHTHSKGRDHGWWGDLTHPAHVEEGETVENSAWKVVVQNQPSCVDTYRTLVRAAQGALAVGEVFEHDGMQL